MRQLMNRFVTSMSMLCVLIVMLSDVEWGVKHLLLGLQMYVGIGILFHEGSVFVVHSACGLAMLSVALLCIHILYALFVGV